MIFAFSIAVPTVVAGDDQADTKEFEAKIRAALKAKNPDYQNGGTFRFKEGKLVNIDLMRCRGITDLSPLKEFDLSAVTSMSLYNAVNIVDISPLSGCPLERLNLERCNKIHDLSPLKGMPLTWFRMYACASVKDLSPLTGMPLEHLDVGLNPLIDDLSPLKGMPIHDLRFDNCPEVTDISVIGEMPLIFVSLFGCPKIEDYKPLGKLKLETLYFDPSLLSDEEITLVREMESLKKIGTSWKDYRKEATPVQFWKRYDDGEFRKSNDVKSTKKTNG